MQDPTQVVKTSDVTYKGIKVKVAFQNEAELELKYLSGGQKAVVVVAMIFAYLKIEAAPFYILDEFDHALDREYRNAIATMINELSQRSQFLITTFKPELIQACENAKILEVKYANRKSKLHEIKQDQALKLI